LTEYKDLLKEREGIRGGDERRRWQGKVGHILKMFTKNAMVGGENGKRVGTNAEEIVIDHDYIH